MIRSLFKRPIWFETETGEFFYSREYWAKGNLSPEVVKNSINVYAYPASGLVIRFRMRHLQALGGFSRFDPKWLDSSESISK